MRLPKKQKKALRRIFVVLVIVILGVLLAVRQLGDRKGWSFPAEEGPGPEAATATLTPTIIQPTSTEEEVDNDMKFGTIKGDSHFRSKPNFNNTSIITVIPAGTTVQLIKRYGPFWYVIWEDMPGYVGEPMIDEEAP